MAASGRTVDSPEARTAISEMKKLIDTDFNGFITAMVKQAGVLSNPTHFDGKSAGTFRDTTWPETKKALDKAKTELGELRDALDKITKDIGRAGGAAS